MNKIETKRMIDLYNLMNNFPEEIHFDMNYWVKYSGPENEIICGTAACDEVYYIFMSKHYEPDVKEKDVAEHIRKVLKDHGVELEWDYE